MAGGVPYNIDLKSPANLTLTFNINLRITVDKSPKNAPLRAVRSPMISQWYNNQNKNCPRNTDSVIEIEELPVEFEDKKNKRDRSTSSRRRSYRSRNRSLNQPHSSIATAKSGSTDGRRSSNSTSNSSSSVTTGSSSGTSLGSSARRPSLSVSTARTPGAVLPKKNINFNDVERQNDSA